MISNECETGADSLARRRIRGVVLIGNARGLFEKRNALYLDRILMWAFSHFLMNMKRMTTYNYTLHDHSSGPRLGREIVAKLTSGLVTCFNVLLRLNQEATIKYNKDFKLQKFMKGAHYYY